MAILYVAAEAAELDPFARLLAGVKKLKWPIDYACEGVLNGRRVLLAANGAGPKLGSHAVEMAIRAVTHADLSSSRLEAVVSTGYCGALTPGIQENDIIIGTRVLGSDPIDCDIPQSEEKFISGAIVSQNRIACLAAEKEQLHATGAIAVDMESEGVGARTKRAELPFYCIKVVTDRADESFSLDLNRMRTAEGRISRGKIGLFAATHPAMLPELFRLKRRSESAAKALGEFLVSCRIESKSNIAVSG